jgi:glyoxylase-like metal-dependent hydrolase (beta-lactamase superfamily II)
LVTTATRLRVLSAATMRVPRSALVAGWPADEFVRIPVPAFLIEHPAGVLLFDAGLAPEAATDPAGAYGERAERLDLRYEPAQRLDALVSSAGYAPTDVDAVVVSHLHFDHAGSAHLFAGASLILGAGELAHARNGADPYCRAVDVERIAGSPIIESAEDTDLFGDGAVTILRTPGHTPGHLSLLVQLAGRSWLLAGDAVHARAALADGRPCPSDADPAAALESARRVVEIADEHGATVWVSHDAAAYEEATRAGCCVEP